MGLGSFESRLRGDGHTSALTHRSISIVTDGRLEVCDAAHRVFVMKNVKGPAQAELERGTLGSLGGREARATRRLRLKIGKPLQPGPFQFTICVTVAEAEL